MSPFVVISNGFDRFHIATAAAQAASRGALSLFLTGAYPTKRVSGLLQRLRLTGHRKLNKLMLRAEVIPNEQVRAFWRSELISASAALAPARHKDGIKARALAAYGATAVRHIERAARSGARVYHYRAGYGGASVRRARELGLVTLCDHSIVHPRLMEPLIRAHGRLDDATPEPVNSPFEQHILDDFAGADHFLLNSQFVRRTFLALGYPADRLHVIYQGIDDGFLGYLPQRTERAPGPMRLLAPAFMARKGAPTLAEALTGFDDVDWTLTISRSIDPATRAAHRTFLSDPRVTCSDPSRPNLARMMIEHDAVVFPTYAEGSARVIFEALAAGIYVITTPNAGSVMQDGVHGRIIPPGDPAAIRAAIVEAWNRRAQFPEIARSGPTFLRANYSEAQYGDRLMALYRQLDADRSGAPIAA